MATEAPHTKIPGKLIAVWAAVSVISAVTLILVQPFTPLSMNVFSLVMLAPGIGALAAAIYPGIPAGLFPARASRAEYGAARLAACVAVLVYFAVLSLLSGAPPELPAMVSGVPILAVIGVQFLGAFSEEIGFRGILQHSLYRRWSKPLTGVLVGLIFGLWHVQNFALPLGEHLLFLASAVVLNVTYTYLMVGDVWQRMVVATVVHVGINLALAYTLAGSGSMGAALAAAIIGGGAAIAVHEAAKPLYRVDAAAGWDMHPAARPAVHG